MSFLSSLEKAFSSSRKSFVDLLLNVVYPAIALDRLNSSAVIEKLLKYKMNINYKDPEGKTMLHRLCCNPSIKNLDVLKILIDPSSKIQINAVDDSGNSALLYAIKNKYFGVNTVLTGWLNIYIVMVPN